MQLVILLTGLFQLLVDTSAATAAQHVYNAGVQGHDTQQLHIECVTPTQAHASPSPHRCETRHG